MATDIKPIETEYAGIKFRSRLEARWAVFFDALGERWQYEPEAFQTSYGVDEEVDTYRWLPDFYLPNYEVWVEVKGSSRSTWSDDWYRICTLADWGSPLPGVDESWGTNRGILLLGDMPRVNDWRHQYLVHPIIQHHKGLSVNSFSFEIGGCRWTPDEFGRSYPVPWIHHRHPALHYDCIDPTTGDCGDPPDLDPLLIFRSDVSLSAAVFNQSKPITVFHSVDEVLDSYRAAWGHRFWNPPRGGE
jgi:hypothetical protein